MEPHTTDSPAARWVTLALGLIALALTIGVLAATNPAGGAGGRLKTMLSQAGYLPLSGPGLVITLDDSGDPTRGEEGILHEQDLLMLINELRAAGARAISIGDGKREERITALSTVRCVGPVVLVNQTQMVPPLTIKALGDPERLMAALSTAGGVVDLLRAAGLKISLGGRDHLTLPGQPGVEGGEW